MAVHAFFGSPARILARAAACALLGMLAACQTPGGGGAPQQGAQPHYKVGKPYEIRGRWFHPKEDPTYEAIGIASWYGDDFHGKRTANGEIFDKTRLSAAHTTLPMPTIVEVHNLESGRKITVRVNDRGPFVGDRIIDLSHAAAEALGFDQKGLARVHVRYVGKADLYALAAPGKTTGRPVRVASAPPQRPRPMGDAPAAPPIAKPISATPASGPASAPASAPAPSPSDPLGSFIEQALTAPPATEFWITVAEYADLNVLELDRGALALGGGSRIVSSPGNHGRYQLQLGPHADLHAAEARLAALREAGYSSAHVAAGSI